MILRIVREDEKLTHIALEGRLDTAGVQEVELKFLAHTASRGKPALIDMSATEYVSSLGMRLLLSTVQTLRKKGARCLLFAVQPLVRETLEMAGLDEIIAPTDDEQEAVRALALSS